MRTNLNTIFTILGVSFFAVNLSLAQTAAQTAAQTWYDSEGRPLIIKGKKIIRQEVVDKEKVAPAVPIIPKALEIRPELLPRPSRVRARKIYQYAHYYPDNGYRGCYRTRRDSRRGLYFKYRSGNFSIRAGY